MERKVLPHKVSVFGVPIHRYRSATELADDIGDYLNGAPLIAGPPGTLYRFKKFVRRNAGLSAAALAVAVALILGLAGTTAMYFRAERLRAEARFLPNTTARCRCAKSVALRQIYCSQPL